MRNRAALGQAEAKWMRMRAAFSTTRAPILSSVCLAEGGELRPCERHPARHGISEREHQPVGGGVQHQPEVVGERALAGGAVGGELGCSLPCAALSDFPPVRGHNRPLRRDGAARPRAK